MKLLVNDANILIDLVKLDLLREFSSLSHKLYTTDFILEELNLQQKKQVQKEITANKIYLIETSEIEDFQGIYDLLESSSGLSFEDCSAWYYSKKLSGTLITGDRRLRKAVEKDEIEVRGILYILDEMLKQEILSFDNAVVKIELLYKLNNRLPKIEIAKRIEFWKNKQHIG